MEIVAHFMRIESRIDLNNPIINQQLESNIHSLKDVVRVQLSGCANMGSECGKKSCTSRVVNHIGAEK